MDDLCEISLKSVCCTCLSTERNLSQLCRIDDGVNNLFFLLSYKSEAYEAMFVKDITQLFICWECTAIIQRLARFRDQVCIAQTKLTDIADGKLNYSKVKCLSKLTYSHQNGYNQEFDIKVEMPENFVDCGPDILNTKVETPDSDEIPLAELTYLKRELEINNDEINDNNDDCIVTDDDVNNSFLLKQLNNGKTTVKNRDTPIIIYRNNEITNPLNVLENLDCFAVKKSKNIKRRRRKRLAEDTDDKEIDHDQNIKKSETKTSYRKRNINSEAYIVNIPITNSDKTDKFNEIQKLDDGKVSLMNKSQSEKNLDRNRDLEPVEKHKVINRDLEPVKKRKVTNRDLEPVEKHKVINRDLEPVVSHIKATNNGVNKYFDIIQMTENEMIKSIEMRKLENDYVNAFNKCEACVRIFEDCDSLEKHISEFHAQKPNHVLCNICKVYVLDEHINTHKKVHYTKYVCRICKESLQCRVDCKRNVEDHLKIKHLMQESYINEQMKMLKELEDLLLYKKPLPEPTYGAKLKVLIDDPKGRGFACVECKKYFKNKNVRNKHIQKHHGEGFQCPTCGKKFAFRTTLRRHEMIHCNPPPRVQCSVCGRMVRADLLKAHAARVHAGAARLACAACGKSFASRRSYEHHLKCTRRHADRREFQHKCAACGKDYRSPGELRDHYNYAHLGKTHHKCPICDKALATPRSVTRHIQTAHRDAKEQVRDQICQTCGKGFTRQKSLKEHELIHTGERPLSCDICARTFRQKASLYTHKRRVHKVALKKKPTHTDEIIVPNSEINKNID